MECRGRLDPKPGRSARAGSDLDVSTNRVDRHPLLAAAEELFYGEGINTVGIDRIIERAGVAKASLYDCFGSKEELIRSYLHARHESRRQRITEGLKRFATPRAKLLGVFDIQGEVFRARNYRGCPST